MAQPRFKPLDIAAPPSDDTSSPAATRPAFRPLEPGDFAPFAEMDLLDFALRLARAHADARPVVLAQSEIGATLLSISGDLHDVLTPLLDVWGPEGVVVREGLDIA